MFFFARSWSKSVVKSRKLLLTFASANGARWHRNPGIQTVSGAANCSEIIQNQRIQIMFSSIVTVPSVSVKAGDTAGRMYGDRWR